MKQWEQRIQDNPRLYEQMMGEMLAAGNRAREVFWAANKGKERTIELTEELRRLIDRDRHAVEWNWTVEEPPLEILTEQEAKEKYPIAHEGIVDEMKEEHPNDWKEINKAFWYQGD